ncbi:hypothetical protein V6N11_036891 [Hibiscus sabdariffa]|uniref:L-dopachrome isomerase n=1 Tax=Hibiscus sabdariffa TaxID=183260 RepID=A0ABR2RBQ1_9ROSI
MPTLNLYTNLPVDAVTTSDILKDATKAVAKIIGKPESYVMILVNGGVPMAFAGTEGRAAYGELISIGGLSPSVNAKLVQPSLIFFKPSSLLIALASTSNSMMFSGHSLDLMVRLSDELLKQTESTSNFKPESCMCSNRQLAIIFLWTSENLFHVVWRGNFEAWVQDPLHVRPIAHTIWDPHFGQPAVEAFTRGGTPGLVNITYSGVYQW